MMRPERTVEPFFRLFDTDDFGYDAFGTSSKQRLGTGDIEPGRKVRGYIGYEVPAAAEVGRLEYSRTFNGVSATWEP